jgi:hypothetical protein
MCLLLAASDWRRGKAQVLLTMVSGLIAFFLATSCFAQSPPLGPPNETVDRYDVPSVALLDIVQHELQAAIDTTNATLKDKADGTTVSALPVQSWPPFMLPTQYTNRPNEWYAKLSTSIGLQVHIPHWFDRQIYLPLDLNVFCAGWAEGNGKIQIDPIFGPPSFEGGSWLEDAPGLSLIRDWVNNSVRYGFGLPATTQTILARDLCVSLGVSVQGTDAKTSAIIFNRPVASNPVHGHPIETPLQPTVEVSFSELKRLVARDMHGNVLYNPTENIILQTYADFTDRESPVLTMHENDQVTLSLAPIVFKAPFLDPLVVLANINQTTSGVQEDSAWVAWPRSTNFSPGTHTLTVTKSYFVPPGSPGSRPGQTKPETVTVPAYELTYSVAYHGVAVLSPSQ